MIVIISIGLVVLIAGLFMLLAFASMSDDPDDCYSDEIQDTP